MRSFIYSVYCHLINLKWRKKNKHNSTNLILVNAFDLVEVGNGTYGDLYVHISSDKYKLKIGNYCSIADNVAFILSSDHPTNHISTFPFKSILHKKVEDGLSKGDIIVGDDVWIGYGVTILSGVTIGQGAIIAAGAIVTKDVDPYSIVGGSPAHVIKYRFKQDLISELMKIDYSKLDIELINKNMDLFYEELNASEQLKWLPKKMEQ